MDYALFKILMACRSKLFFSLLVLGFILPCACWQSGKQSMHWVIAIFCDAFVSIPQTLCMGDVL